MNDADYFTIIVAEDEQIIQEDIKEKIEIVDKDIKVIDLAMNGEDALESITRYKPDILFTDIKMPIINGLDLIKKAKEIHPTIFIVILSGYSDFSYAQQAIKYNVTDYLLKPLRIEELKEVIFNIKNKLIKKREEIEKIQISDSLKGINSDKDIEPSLLEKNYMIFQICLGNLFNYVPELLDMNHFASYWDMIDWPMLINECFTSDIKWWIINVKHCNIKLLILSYSKGNNLSYNKIIENLLQEISNRLHHSTSVNLCCDETPVSFSELKETSARINTMLANRLVPFRSSVIRMSDEETEIKPQYFDYTIINIIEKALDHNDLEIVKEELKKIIYNWKDCRCTQKHIQKGLVKCIKHILEYSGCRNTKTIESAENSIIRIVALSNSFDELFNSSVEQLNHYIKPLLKSSHSSKALFEKIEGYMKSNYTKPLNVAILADKFNYNSSHIIRIFKKFSGLTPIQFLIILRIDKAREIIAEDHNLNFKMISEIVGYEDQNYFSRMFKKVTGTNPSEYRDSLKK